MRRVIGRIATLLVLGAVVNVVVAWGCAYAGFRSLTAPAFGIAPSGLIPLAPWRSEDGPIEVPWLEQKSPFIPERLHQITASRFGMEVEHITGGGQYQHARISLFADRVISGLPLRCLHGGEWNMRVTTYADDIGGSGAAVSLIPTYGRFSALPAIGIETSYVLPAAPIWSGFIVNTLFYALLLWLLVAMPSSARRMIRRRRGLCEKCAYPIGVSPVCTECGAAVTRLACGSAPS